MHSSFKVYLLTGTLCKGNGQLCQYNLAKFYFLFFFFNVKLISLKKKKNLHMCARHGKLQVQPVLVQIPICANMSGKAPETVLVKS